MRSLCCCFGPHKTYTGYVLCGLKSGRWKCPLWGVGPLKCPLWGRTVKVSVGARKVSYPRTRGNVPDLDLNPTHHQAPDYTNSI